MSNECPMDSQHKCDQVPRDCDLCRLGYLKATYEAALSDYRDALDKRIEKLKEKQNEHTRFEAEQIPDPTGH